MVECQLPKLDVEGSNPFARFAKTLAKRRVCRGFLLPDGPCFISASGLRGTGNVTDFLSDDANLATPLNCHV